MRTDPSGTAFIDRVFGREAQTNPANGLLTLPSTLLDEAPSELAMTLIHESAHGANTSIVDAAYGSGSRASSTG